MDKSAEEHWDDRYRSVASDQLSWFTPEPATSLVIIDRLALPPNAGIIDVGGGEAFLVDRLIGQGFTDVTVLDISDVALNAVQQRVGTAAQWIRADVLVDARTAMGSLARSGGVPFPHQR